MQSSRVLYEVMAHKLRVEIEDHHCFPSKKRRGTVCCPSQKLENRTSRPQDTRE